MEKHVAHSTHNMKAYKLLIFIIACFNSQLSAEDKTSEYHSENNAILTNNILISNCTYTVNSVLERYPKDGDITPLLSLDSVLVKMSGRNVFEQLKRTELRIKILNALYLTKDTNYDINNPEPFYMNVAPPMTGKEPVFSGMRPEDIKDPDMRKQYERDIKINNERAEKYVKELSINRKIQDYTYYIQNDIKRCLREYPEITNILYTNINVYINDDVAKSNMINYYRSNYQVFNSCISR